MIYIRDANRAAAEGAAYGWQIGKGKAQQQIKQNKPQRYKPVIESEVDGMNDVISGMYGKKRKWL